MKTMSVIGVLVFVVLAVITVHEHMELFFALHIFIPYLFVFIALSLVTFGIAQCRLLVKVLASYVIDIHFTQRELYQLTCAIWHSYIACFLWVIYAGITAFEYLENNPLSYVVSQVCVSLSYGFCVAELVLRPVLFQAKHKYHVDQ